MHFIILIEGPSYRGSVNEKIISMYAQSRMLLVYFIVHIHILNLNPRTKDLSILLNDLYL